MRTGQRRRIVWKLVLASWFSTSSAWALSSPVFPEKAEPPVEYAEPDKVAQDQQVDVLMFNDSVRIVAWTSNYDPAQFRDDQDIIFARSTDQGGTWSAPAAINGDAASDQVNDYGARLATDGKLIVAVWQTGYDVPPNQARDIRFAWSENRGETWHDGPTISRLGDGDDQAPSIATNGINLWVAVWEGSGPGTFGGGDIFFATSFDGKSWSAPAPIHPEAQQGAFKDETPAVECDPSRCVAVWKATFQDDSDIHASSFQNGIWTDPGIIGIYDEAIDDQFPTISTDQAGTWLAVWKSTDNRVPGSSRSDFDLIFARGSEDGSAQLGWSTPEALNTDADSDDDDHIDDRAFDVVIDKGLQLGIKDDTWVAVWEKGPRGSGGEIVYASSGNNGSEFDWSNPQFLDSDAPVDTRHDAFPQIGISKHRLEVAWEGRGSAVTDPFGSDSDIFVQRGFLPPPGCLEGTLTGPDVCFNGNTGVGDGCRPDCTKEIPGDGYLDPGEECDDGNDNQDDGCRVNGMIARCGDGLPDDGEECDDGNEDENGPDGCDYPSCKPSCSVAKPCPRVKRCVDPICVPLSGISGSVCTDGEDTPQCISCVDDLKCQDDDPCTLDSCQDTSNPLGGVCERSSETGLQRVKCRLTGIRDIATVCKGLKGGAFVDKVVVPTMQAIDDVLNPTLCASTKGAKKRRKNLTERINTIIRKVSRRTLHKTLDRTCALALLGEENEREDGLGLYSARLRIAATGEACGAL